MTTPTPTMFQLTALDPAQADGLRRRGGEVYVCDSKPGFPCRQCLCDAEVGEELLLVSHDPFEEHSASPYRSASPIFLHRRDCGAPVPTDELPSQLTVRQLSVRAFDRNDMMIDAAVIDGVDLAASVEEMFADELTAMLHVHNAQRGCFAVKVERVEPELTSMCLAH